MGAILWYPPGIDSAEDPEVGPDNGPRRGTIPNPTNEGWTLAPKPKLDQEAGPVRTRPSQFSMTDDPKSARTVGSCLVSQSLRAFDALPNVPADTSRQSHRDHVQKSFYAGMYTHGGISALRATHAESIKTFTALILAVHPKQIFTSLVVLDGSQNSLHRDSRNACVPNLVIPLTSFSGGELFLEKPERTLRGEIIPFIEGAVAFDARHVHHGGLPSPDRRVVLIAYCLQGASRLNAQNRKLLTELGFCLPTAEPRFATGFPDLRPLGFRPQPVPDALPALRCRKLLFIELCSGSGGLSAAFRSFGLSGVGDRPRWEPPSAHGSHPLFRSSLRQFVVLPPANGHVACNPVGAHCTSLRDGQGTWTPAAAKRVASNWPPGLSETDQSRTANFCMWLRHQVAKHDLPTHFCVENPLRSYMWMIPEFVELKPHCLHLAYDVCMHGGDRDKRQMLWTSLPELQALAVTCDRSHPHRPWGQTASGSFVTTSETEYPPWPDANLHHDLVQGFRLIGDEQPSGIFPVEPKPALASIEEFWERALLVKHALWQKVADSPLLPGPVRGY